MINNYYLLINGEKIGPHTQYEIMDMNLNVHTMILSPLADDWGELVNLPEFNAYLEDKGIYVPTKANLASFWWRLLAYIIDYIIISIITGLFIAALYIIISFTEKITTEDAALKNKGIDELLMLIALILYHSVFEATNLRGGIGKVICNLSVVNAIGGRITFLNALGRNTAKLFSYFFLGLGFLSILWNSKRQGWHDGIAKTYMIRRK